MNTIHLSVFYLFTFFLFVIFCYLLYLRIFVLARYIDFITKVNINLATYLIVVYFVALFSSLLISVFFYGASLAGELIGSCASSGVNLEELKPTHEIVYSPGTGEWVVLDKKTGTPILSQVQSQDKVNTLIETAKGQTPDSIGNPELNSPAESGERRNSFIGQLGHIFFKKLPQSSQEQAALGSGTLMKTVAEKTGMDPGNEKTVLMGIDHFSNLKKVRIGTELGLPVSELQKGGIDVGYVTFTCVGEDGSLKKFDCTNKVKVFEDMLRYYRTANGHSKLNPVQEQILFKWGKTLGYNKVLCIAHDDITPLPAAGKAYPDLQPPSPSGSTFDNFNN